LLCHRINNASLDWKAALYSKILLLNSPSVNIDDMLHWSFTIFTRKFYFRGRDSHWIGDCAVLVDVLGLYSNVFLVERMLFRSVLPKIIGAPPLVWACDSNHIETAKLLLSRGARVNLTDKVQCAFEWGVVCLHVVEAASTRITRS